MTDPTPHNEPALAIPGHMLRYPPGTARAISEIDSGRPVDGRDAARLATMLLEIARLAMPDTYFAVDSRCHYARAVLAAGIGQVDIDATGTQSADLADDEFTQDLIGRCKIAVREYEGRPSGAWSTGEQVAVALVLRHREYLAGMGYNPTDAAKRVVDGMLIPPADFNAWLAAVRAAAGVK